MIRSSADRETERIWIGVKSRKLPADIQDRALVKLTLINRAQTIDDLRIPAGNRLEALKGNRSGGYSVRINDQWRICFNWRDGGAYNVEIVDYH